MADDNTQAILAAIERLSAGQDQTRRELAQTRADIMERIDRLQQAVGQVRGEVVVNFGHADRIERIAQSARDEGRILAETVRVMQRQIKLLQTDLEQLRGAGQ